MLGDARFLVRYLTLTSDQVSPLRTLTRRRVDKVKLLYKHVDVISDKDMYHFAQLRFEFYYADNIFCGWKKKVSKVVSHWSF